jgi:hypothetical protein
MEIAYLGLNIVAALCIIGMVLPKMTIIPELGQVVPRLSPQSHMEGFRAN